MMKVRFGKEEDFELVQKIDDSIVFPEYKKWIDNKQVYLIFENEEKIWDKIKIIIKQNDI